MIKDVLTRILKLVSAQKVPDDNIHKILNGCIINGEYIYRNGMLEKDGRLTTLSPDRIEMIEPAIKSNLPPKPVMRKSGRNN
ncbi:hypothetical protein LCGC14_0814700 [marine sediment metagenome]|uniref:Uncharacterized protein n=1 Tax=marine sediment metagenome TaxID=412755 RepID=A0A0F9PQ87_9ZZZZ